VTWTILWASRSTVSSPTYNCLQVFTHIWIKLTCVSSVIVISFLAKSSFCLLKKSSSVLLIRIQFKKLFLFPRALLWFLSKADYLRNVVAETCSISSSNECRMAITLCRVCYTPLLHYLLFAPEKNAGALFGFTALARKKWSQKNKKEWVRENLLQMLGERVRLNRKRGRKKEKC
jgi:hypothetical protein